MKTGTLQSPKVEETRVERLRQRIVQAPQEVCIERARYFTESMALNWEKPALTRMSLAFEHVLKNMSVIIRDDEIIVGCRTSKLKGAPLFPENKIRWIEGDVDNLTIVLFRGLSSLKKKREN